MLALVAMLWSCCWSAVAQTQQDEETREVEYLVVELIDGEASSFALEDAPHLTFANGEVVVKSNESSVSFSLDGVKNYHFVTKTVSLGIERITTTPSANEPTQAFTNGKATFSGLKAGATIAVYTIDGRAVKTVKAAEDGSAEIDLGSLPTGIYIVRTPAKSFKVYQK